MNVFFKKSKVKLKFWWVTLGIFVKSGFDLGVFVKAAKIASKFDRATKACVEHGKFDSLEEKKAFIKSKF